MEQQVVTCPAAPTCPASGVPTCPAGAPPRGVELGCGIDGLPQLTHVHVCSPIRAAHRLLLLTHALLLFILSSSRLTPQSAPTQPVEHAPVPGVAGLAL